jgi:predicted nucleotidyltransferase
MTDIAELRGLHIEKLETELPRIRDELRRLGASLIILFGSYAKGRRDLFTDLDILAVMPSDEGFVQRLARVHQAVAPRVATDLFVYTPEEFDQIKLRPFWNHALASGLVLHEDR